MKRVFWILLLGASFSMTAQNYKFGKVSKAELEEKMYAKDSSASAAVLYRKVKVAYNYIRNTGFQITTTVHERVKFYTKEGFDYATVTEVLYKDGSSARENLSSLKAYTYNLENGSIVKTKLKSSETFSKSLSNYFNEEKFTMPNVQEGSVVEYQYKIISPFYWSIDEIPLQYDIPIKKQEVSINIPEFYSFKPSMKGYLSVSPKYSSINGKVNFTNTRRNGVLDTNTKFSTSSLDYRIDKTDYSMTDVPALEEEPFVNDMDNYRSSINYELQFVKFPDEPVKSYTTNWEKVVKTIYESPSFGGQLAYKNYFKGDLSQLLANASTEVEKAAAIFYYVQQHMNWNGSYGKYTEKGVKKAYKEKTGNTAEINLMLVAMCNAAGLKANPVLISTRDHGIPIFPTREGFNYVVASVNLEGQIILMDACNKFTEPNLLPSKALNWFGRIIAEDGSSSIVPVVPGTKSKELNTMKITINLDGSIAGKARKTYTFHNAYQFRNKYAQISEDDYITKLENNHGGLEISNYKMKNKMKLGTNIMESYDFLMEDQINIIGDKIYFSPLFFHAETENPFKLEERNYPIDFVYPWQEKYVMSIVLPDGYEVASLPENASFALEDNMGSFSYKVNQLQNTLQVLVEVKLNEAVIPPSHYAGIKELFKNIVEKETEKVVLSKI
ncbi:DUF3857 domain-containing protein [Spongiimicrobium salis]|uniref:DUF3857 domain-containing protein n=1 Tax=Spongiimicrobium salis TaxID=1667022 RepID=UPI00374D3080